MQPHACHSLRTLSSSVTWWGVFQSHKSFLDSTPSGDYPSRWNFLSFLTSEGIHPPPETQLQGQPLTKALSDVAGKVAASPTRLL